MSVASLEPLWAAASAYLIVAAPYLALAAVALALVILLVQMRLHRRLRRLALGRNGSLEESVTILAREMKEHKEFRAEVEKYLKLAEARMRGALSGIGVVRFNPFEGIGQGGNQSSAIALIDEHGGGVVLSTLYSRGRVAVYTKPLAAGTSSYELTQEERSAIEQAKEHIAKIKRLPAQAGSA